MKLVFSYETNVHASTEILYTKTFKSICSRSAYGGPKKVIAVLKQVSQIHLLRRKAHPITVQTFTLKNSKGH